MIIGGRYGLSSKDTTPAQMLAVFNNLKANEPKNQFTVGIVDGNAALIGRTLPPEGVARIDAFLAGFPTVDGDCFDLERLDGSKHRAIMRMNLVNSVDGK